VCSHAVPGLALDVGPEPLGHAELETAEEDAAGVAAVEGDRLVRRQQGDAEEFEILLQICSPWQRLMTSTRLATSLRRRCLLQ